MPRPEPEVLERDGETDALRAALMAARASRGSLTVIEGNAGAGKSTLVELASALARQSGIRVLSGRGGELEQDHPFGVMRQLYEPALSAASERDRARLLAGAAAPAAQALGLIDGGSAALAAGFTTMHALYWLTTELAANGPLLVSIDDAHWADASSLRALDYLARRLMDLPVVLLAAFRPDEPGTRLALINALRSAATTRLSPAPLGQESVARIVRERVPEASAELCAACHTVTAGNPLYLHEVLRTVHVGGALPSAEDVLAMSVRLLGDQVIRRVERVGPGAPSLARAIAVLGSGARLATAAELGGPAFERGWTDRP